MLYFFWIYLSSHLVSNFPLLQFGQFRGAVFEFYQLLQWLLLLECCKEDDFICMLNLGHYNNPPLELSFELLLSVSRKDILKIFLSHVRHPYTFLKLRQRYFCKELDYFAVYEVLWIPALILYFIVSYDFIDYSVLLLNSFNIIGHFYFVHCNDTKCY